MEKLKKLVQEKTGEEAWNLCREFLQTLTLKMIFQSKYGNPLSFMGGTCLRLCYDLRRYSEDLDFALDNPQPAYNFSDLLGHLSRELRLLGYHLSFTIQEEKIVQKAFLKFEDLPSSLGLQKIRQQQKMHIKLEVDTCPPPLEKTERESFFINRFGEIFPILKHTLPTLFAGKILAALYRQYVRGRDFYDLIWYLGQKTPINLGYLNRSLKKEEFKNEDDVWRALEKRVHEVQPEIILKDITRFLDDPKEANWISRYQEAFSQFLESRKSKTI